MLRQSDNFRYSTNRWATSVAEKMPNVWFCPRKLNKKWTRTAGCISLVLNQLDGITALCVPFNSSRCHRVVWVACDGCTAKFMTWRYGVFQLRMRHLPEEIGYSCNYYKLPGMWLNYALRHQQLCCLLSWGYQGIKQVRRAKRGLC
jgi:hypothetical protein